MSGANERFGLLARGVERDMSEKGWAPNRFWALWVIQLVMGVVAFYVVLTPVWLGLRVAAWIAEFRARRRS
jgi:hypothetical protein